MPTFGAPWYCSQTTTTIQPFRSPQNTISARVRCALRGPSGERRSSLELAAQGPPATRTAIRRGLVAQRPTPTSTLAPAPPSCTAGVPAQRAAGGVSCPPPAGSTEAKVESEVRGAHVPYGGARCTRARCLALARGTAALPHSTNAHRELRMRNTPCAPQVCMSNGAQAQAQGRGPAEPAAVGCSIRMQARVTGGEGERGALAARYAAPSP